METPDISSAFTWLDWSVVIGYMILTTIVGEKLSGKQSSIKDFFLGGRSLPWWAVSGSMIATEISALTFIGVPAAVYALNGDWTYLQWGIGSIIARFLVGFYLVPLYYKKEIYSPYDFMGSRLGEGIRRLVTVLFSIGGVLGASVRVVVTAVILQVVTGLSPVLCISIIGLFAVLWTFMGGMKTVIWTDAIQFVLLVAGGIVACIWLWNDVGWSQVIEINRNTIIDGEKFDKMNMWNLTPLTENPALGYTLWVGIFAMPFQNFAAFGVDQLNTQRMFCCSSEKDAKKAMCWSSVSLLITVLMMMVGAGLYAWYRTATPEFMPSPEVAAEISTEKDRSFPTWIVHVLPPGVSGLILAAAFAAAISSLDSILAALSQTSLSIIYGREKLEDQSKSKERVRESRIAVIIWGVILTVVSFGIWGVYEKNPDGDLIKLAFGMIAYTFGPLLGVLLAAIFVPRASFKGLLIGTIISILFVAWFRPELPLILEGISLDGLAKNIIDWRPAIDGKSINSSWFFPINAGITLLFGAIFQRKVSLSENS